jgi:hypothetical protein
MTLADDDKLPRAYTSEDKLQFEVEKLTQEVKLMKQPWLQPTFWIGIIALTVSVVGNISQFLTMESKVTIAKADIAQAKLDTFALDEKRTVANKELGNLNKEIAETKDYITNAKCSDFEECKRLLSKIKINVGDLEEQAGLVKESVVADGKDSKTKVENKPAIAVKPIPVKDLTIDNKQLKATPDNKGLPKVEPSNKQQIAEAKETEGFKNLINGNYDGALVAFQASEDTYNAYNNVYEIARLLRRNKSQMGDPLKKKEVFQTIVKKYSYGAPPDLLKQVAAIANQ